MSSESNLFQNLYRKYAPVFSSKAYTPLAANASERNNWDVDERKSIDASSVSSDQSGLDAAERPSILNDKSDFKPYRDAFDDEKELDFEHLSNFTPEPDKTTCWENWYLPVTAALLAFHHEKAVSFLWEHISRTRANDEDPHYVTKATERITDACLKSAVIVGLPRATEALSSLSSVIQISERKDPEDDSSSTVDEASSQDTKDGENPGRQIFEQTHGTQIGEALDSMGLKCCQEPCSTTIQNMYGNILSGSGVLNAVETAMIAFASCLADNMPIQAESFFHGCKKLGATDVEMSITASIVREVAAELGVECPGVGEAFAFMNRDIS